MTSCGKKRDYMGLSLYVKDPITVSCLDELRRAVGGGWAGKSPGGIIVHSFPTDKVRITNLEHIKDAVPLRNFLIEKQKGASKLASLLSLFLMVDKSQNVNFGLKFDKEFLRQISKNVVDPYMEVFFTLYEATRGLSISVETEAAISEFVYNPSMEKLLLNASLSMSNLEKYIGESSRMSLYISFASKSCESGTNRKSYSDFILQSMYNMDDAMKDLTVWEMNGMQIKCHGSILAAQSPVFASMLSPECGMKEAETGKVELDYTHEATSEFVKFVYGIELKEDAISPELAIELLQLAHKYEVKELEGTLLNILSKKKMDWYSSVDNLMELYYYVRGIDNLGLLRAHALTELSQLSADRIMSSEYFNKLETDEGKKFLGILHDWNGCNFFG